jgi:D-arabinose 1-dehydrogenase-like Zn-dependent alcohol dehydrogenase
MRFVALHLVLATDRVEQLSLLGTTMGSPTDFQMMTAYVARHAIHPVVSHRFKLDDVAQAFALMEAGGQFGKIVIELE